MRADAIANSLNVTGQRCYICSEPLPTWYIIDFPEQGPDGLRQVEK